MAKRQKEPEKENEGAGMMRWLLTYSDMITLLLAFFVVMYASSNVDSTKFKALSQAMSAAFGLTGNPAILNAGGAEGAKPMVFPASQLQVTEIKNKLAKHVLEQKIDAAVNMHLNERGLLIRIYADKVKFERGKAALSPVYKKLLDKVALVLASTPNAIQVNGYTDDDISKNKSKELANWDLSSQRAVNTVKYLITRGVQAERLSAAGFAQYHPIVPNSDEVHRTLNRRIDIQVFKAPVLDELMNAGKVEEPKNPGLQPQATPALEKSGLNLKPLTF
jgi:chemotaxis protein MotB